uniref:chloride channel protein n=1 Tax=Pectinatus frisingensis TaxID=865 RepID=UPI0018C45B8C
GDVVTEAADTDIIGIIAGITGIVLIWFLHIIQQYAFGTGSISVLAFTIIGTLSMWHPEILGNGKAGNQLSFTNAIDWQYGLSLFAAKWLAVILATAAGAYGGHITPSMMLGGMIGLTFAAIWNGIFLVIPVGMAAFIGATVYLGLAQEMPIMAAIFLIEMSRFSPAYLFPICICFATAMPIFIYLQEKTA